MPRSEHAQSRLQIPLALHSIETLTSATRARVASPDIRTVPVCAQIWPLRKIRRQIAPITVFAPEIAPHVTPDTVLRERLVQLFLCM